MSQKYVPFYAVMLLILISFTGCEQIIVTPTTEIIKPSPTNTDIPPTPINTATIEPPYKTTGGVFLGANLNCPNRSAFGIIVENTPCCGAIIDSFPFQFRWYYQPLVSPPSDWSTECVPTSFTMYLSKGPEYTSSIAVPVVSPIVEDIVNFLFFKYEFSGDLDPVSVYRWLVVGHTDTLNIDDEQLSLFQDHAIWADNVWEHPHGQFQTGPRCSAGTMQPVMLFNPADEAVLDSDTPIFQWGMTGCSANAFRLAFSRDPQFNNIEIAWATSSLEFLMYPDILEPCTQYYWRVDAGPYSVDYHRQRGNWETTSETRAFIIRSADCPDAVVDLSTATPTATYVPPPAATPTAKKKPTQEPCENFSDKTSCESHSYCKWQLSPNPTAMIYECVAK